MTTDELKQLVDLHEAYDKHVPATYASFGQYGSPVRICKTCLAPLLLALDGKHRLLHRDIMLAVASISQQWPTIFKEMVKQAKELDMLQAYADLMLVDGWNCMGARDLWILLGQMCLPSEPLLTDMMTKHPEMLVDAAMHFPGLKSKAYEIVLACNKPAVMHSFCRTTLRHTDARLLAAAKAATAGQAAGPAEEYKLFEIWHYKKLAWEK